MSECKHNWVKFEGRPYPYRVFIMILCDQLEGCTKCGCVKAWSSTPLGPYDDDGRDFYFTPKVIISVREYLHEAFHASSNWQEHCRLPKEERDKLDLRILVSKEIGWPGWVELPDGYIEAWKELDSSIGGDSLREFDRMVARFS